MKNFIKQITPPFLFNLAKSFVKGNAPDSDFIFTNNWFASARENFEIVLSQLQPTKILEIGSFEGESLCYLIERLAKDSDLEIHCVDTWEGGVEHKSGGFAQSNMNSVESRFKRNTQLAIKSAPKKVSLITHKCFSDVALSQLISHDKKCYFDYIYIDGSHQAPDVLFDAVGSFKLLRIGGIMAFDDYLWAEKLPYGIDPLRCPKPAIDAFVNINIRKLKVLNAPLGQIYIQKTSD